MRRTTMTRRARRCPRSADPPRPRRRFELPGQDGANTPIAAIGSPIIRPSWASGVNHLESCKREPRPGNQARLDGRRGVTLEESTAYGRQGRPYRRRRRFALHQDVAGRLSAALRPHRESADAAARWRPDRLRPAEEARVLAKEMATLGSGRRRSGESRCRVRSIWRRAANHRRHGRGVLVATPPKCSASASPA